MRKIVIILFIASFLLRVFFIIPSNTVIGFDQARDLWDATTIFRDTNIRIVGPTAGNNPNLHHGVAWLYFIIPPLIIFQGNPIGVVIWNGFFSALLTVVLFYFAKSLFGDKKSSLISSIIVGVSFYYIQFAGWLSNSTVCLFTVPVFFFGLWEYYKGKKWGLPLSFLFLGLTIQFELFFVYLIPTFIIAWIILKPKFPNFKLVATSAFLFVLSTSTMILTEIKFNFAGIKSILGAGSFVGGEKSDFFQLLFIFLRDKWDAFYLNFWPQYKSFGIVFGLIVVGFFIWEIFRRRKDKLVIKRNLFLLLIYFSPIIMLTLGYHNAPWFLIGRPFAAILMASYLISRIRSKFLLTSILIFIIFANLLAVKDSYGRGQILLEPDDSSLMSSQLMAVDYSYMSSSGESFEINSLTNPLYINAVWSYHYYWYGKNKYGYLPTWGGGDQLYPYDSLSYEGDGLKYLYLLIDTSVRIPPQYRNEIIGWADKKSTLVEEKTFGGIYVQKRIITSLK